MRFWQKILAALALAAAAIAAVAFQRSTVEKNEAQAYDVAHAKELSLPFIDRYGIVSFAPGGKVAKTTGGLVFSGMGIDKQGKRQSVEIHFTAVFDGNRSAAAISEIAIGGQAVFRARR